MNAWPPTRDQILRGLSLAGSLFFFWLCLSGHYTPMLIAAGLASAIACTAVAFRLRTLDSDGVPVHLLPRVVNFHPWLIVEILKSGLRVAKAVLNPRLPISPTMTVLTPTQTTPVGLATYANAITLTPGTLSVDVGPGRLLIHSLSRHDAADLEEGSMDRRVTAFEGES